MKILFVTTRSPLSLSEQDGGSVFTSQVIRYFGPRSQLDILFLRAPDLSLADLPHVNTLHFLAPDATVSNRFTRRLGTSRLVQQWFSNRYKDYDVVLLQHVSSGFGMVGLPEEAMQKMVVV